MINLLSFEFVLLVFIYFASQRVTLGHSNGHRKGITHKGIIVDDIQSFGQLFHHHENRLKKAKEISLDVFERHTKSKSLHRKETNKKKVLRNLFKQYWDWRLLNNPEYASTVGVFNYDDRVNEMSLSSFKRRASAVQIFHRQLTKLKNSIEIKMHPTLNLNMNLLENDLRLYLTNMKFHTYVWPLGQLEGPHITPINMINSMKTKTVTDLMNIMARLRLLPQQINEHIALLSEGIRIGQTLHRKSFENLLKVFKKMGEGEAEKSSFFKPFLKKPNDIPVDEWGLFVQEARDTIKKYIQPAYTQFYDFMVKTYLPKARPNIALLSVPNGHEFYAALLKYHTTTDFSPQQIHHIGLSEVKRINTRMELVRKTVGFNGTLGEFRKHLRTDKKFGFRDAEHMLKYFDNLLTKVKGVLPKYFSSFPKTPFVIRAVPVNLQVTSPLAYYEPPTFKEGKGVFYINTYKPQTRRCFSANTIFLHEGIPGHHMQIALQITHHAPAFRRYAGMGINGWEAPATFQSYTGFVEGWALYSEYLGEEMGMFPDQYSLFGRLSDEMLRACRLVVDTGIHVFGWSRQKAVDYMQANTADDFNDIESEINRYITTPGQACGYKIGEMEIRRLRNLVEKRLGKKFSLKKFHDFVLSLGPVPLTVLRTQTEKFITNSL